MKKTIYIHIGLHKTATTTIQFGLKQNQNTLQAAGYLYPQTGMIFAGQHNVVFGLNRALRFNSAQGSITDLLEEIRVSPFDKAIVSSEEFDWMKLPVIQELRELTQAFDVKILVYLRRQDQILQSTWVQYAKMGHTIRDFEDWLSLALKNEKKFFYSQFLGMWSETFGRENVRVCVLEKSMKTHVLFHFLAMCDLISPEVLAKLQLPKNLNISPGIKTITLIQHFVKGFSGQLNAMELEQVTVAIKNFGQMQPWNDQSPNLVDARLFQRISEHYAQENRQVAQTYLQREQLFLDPYEEKPVTHFPIEQTTHDELRNIAVHVIAQIYSQFRKPKNP